MTVDDSVEVLIIGAGISGIGAGIALLRQGVTSFAILERAEDIGGTWRDNTYPGVAVDIPSASYCFSFETDFPWSNTFARGREIHAYVSHCARKYGVSGHIRFGSCASRACFDEARDRWVTELHDGRIVTSRYLIAATGTFGRPKLPGIDGLERFDGPVMHSGRWDHSCNLTSQRVAIIGTGASAVQIIPEIASKVEQLTVFQRTPIWVAPRRDVTRTRSQGRTLRRLALVRNALRRMSEAQIALLTFFIVNYRYMQPAVRLIESILRRWMRRQVCDPDLAARLIPSYGLGCKRPATSNTYLSTFNRRNVVLETRPIERILPTGIVTDDGTLHEAGVIVLATGFMTTERCTSPDFDVIGRDGVELGRWWEQNRRQAHAGVTVHGFPNFFLTSGPYSGGFNWFAMLKANLAHILCCIDHAAQSGATRIEVRGDVQERYMQHTWRRANGTVFKSATCAASNSYYIDRLGDASLPLPHTPIWRVVRGRLRGTKDYVFSTTARGSASNALGQA